MFLGLGGLIGLSTCRLRPEDLAWPYMMSERVPDDTLFLVCEADFRFWEQDCMAPHEWLPMTVVAPELGAGGDNEVFRGYRASERSSQEEAGVSAELLDVLNICNSAVRCRRADGYHCGDVVWLSWNAGVEGQKKPTKRNPGTTIAYGSQFIAWTKVGAERALEHARQERDPWHIDTWLHNLLKRALDLNASYVCPPLGGFASHSSPNLRGAVRPTSFGEWWSFPGSGRERLPSGTSRYLQPFCQGDLRPPSPAARFRIYWPIGRHSVWTTEQPPLSLQHFGDDGTLVTLLNDVRWLSYDEFPPRYIGPPKGREKGAGKAWDQLVRTPDLVRTPEQRGGGPRRSGTPILTVLMERLVTLDIPDAPALRDAHNVQESEARRRVRRAQVAQYMRRAVCPEHEEVFLVYVCRGRMCGFLSHISAGP